jgi:hypothetical protein
MWIGNAKSEARVVMAATLHTETVRTIPKGQADDCQPNAIIGGVVSTGLISPVCEAGRLLRRKIEFV